MNNDFNTHGEINNDSLLSNKLIINSDKSMNLSDVLVNLPSTELTSLSSCYAGLIPSKKVSIEYDETEETFVVSLTIDGSSKTPDETALIIKNLPLVIGQKSKCACGSPLKVTNYKIEGYEDNIYFEGSYSCPVCKQRKGSFLAKILNSLSKAWQDTRKVEVSLKGVVYEKNSKE